MPKRKGFIVSDNDDEEEYETSDADSSAEDQKPRKSTASTGNTRQKKPRTVKEEEDEEDQLDPQSDEEKPLLKKPVTQVPKTSSKAKKDTVKKENTELADNGDIVVRSTAEGEKYIELGKRKRATVRVFKGNVFVDIREFYQANGGEEKPGKKGISLGLDQWETLKKSASAIDGLFAELKK